MNLVAYSEELLPPELLLDSNHPVNDQYIKDISNLKRMIVSHTIQMHPKTVEMCKLAHTGLAYTEIAEKLKRTPLTVSKHVRSEKGQRLLALLSHLKMGIDGPNEAQRINMLWRIARENEDAQSRTSIAAIAEINRMTIALEPIAPAQTTIVINQTLFPKGALDGD